MTNRRVAWHKWRTVMLRLGKLHTLTRSVACQNFLYFPPECDASYKVSRRIDQQYDRVPKPVYNMEIWHHVYIVRTHHGQYFGSQDSKLFSSFSTSSFSSSFLVFYGSQYDMIIHFSCPPRPANLMIYEFARGCEWWLIRVILIVLPVMARIHATVTAYSYDA